MIIFTVFYSIFGIIAITSLGLAARRKRMIQEIGDDWKKPENEEFVKKIDEEREQEMNDDFIPNWQISGVIILMIISWPVAYPIILHKLNTTDFFD